jgi:hypothetical protein
VPPRQRSRVTIFNMHVLRHGTARFPVSSVQLPQPLRFLSIITKSALRALITRNKYNISRTYRLSNTVFKSIICSLPTNFTSHHITSSKSPTSSPLHIYLYLICQLVRHIVAITFSISNSERTPNIVIRQRTHFICLLYDVQSQ